MAIRQMCLLIVLKIIVARSDVNTLDENALSFVQAVKDIVKYLPSNRLTIVSNGNHLFLTTLLQQLQQGNIAVENFNISHSEMMMNKTYDFIKMAACNSRPVTCLFLVHVLDVKQIIGELTNRDLMRRNFLYLFYWPIKTNESKHFVENVHEILRVVIITNPRSNVFRLFYNQAHSKQKNFQLVNWWTKTHGLYYRPTLPSAFKVYGNFHRKLLTIPIVHKPPWFFVKYNSSNMDVEGGRDHNLVMLLARKLNFRYKYIDPPDKNDFLTGTMDNISLKGTIGLVARREADFVLGDIGIILESSQVVEFSFFTLADSGAFVTHAPSVLNEALALIRPFKWNVWPPVLTTIILTGPCLYFIIIAPTLWSKRERTIRKVSKKSSHLFEKCFWYSIMLFLRQTGKPPSESQRARILIIVISLVGTYIIGDIYSANMTSLLVRPTREEPIRTLHQLEDAMINRHYKLYVEKHSSVYSVLENGTGVYRRLWNLMQKQSTFTVDSVEDGIKLVRGYTNIALIAGRETLYFDTRRFGASNFYLGEKLYTLYSAIAFQNGCPYIENINLILMRLFDAGILTKMTEEEYEKLGRRTLNKTNNDNALLTLESDNFNLEQNEKRSVAINLKMLQGAFYVLLVGYVMASVSFACEIVCFKHSRDKFWTKKRKRHGWKRVVKVAIERLKRVFRRVKERVKRGCRVCAQNLMDDDMSAITWDFNN